MDRSSGQLECRAPVHPDIARRARVQGVVILRTTPGQAQRGESHAERGETRGLYADTIERRARSRHHDGHGQLQALVALGPERAIRVQEDAKCSSI